MFLEWKTLRFSQKNKELSDTYDRLRSSPYTFIDCFGGVEGTDTVYVLVYNYEAIEQPRDDPLSGPLEIRHGLEFLVCV